MGDIAEALAYGQWGSYDYEDAFEGPFRSRRPYRRPLPVCERCGERFRWGQKNGRFVQMSLSLSGPHKCSPETTEDDFPIVP